MKWPNSKSGSRRFRGKSQNRSKRVGLEVGFPLGASTGAIGPYEFQGRSVWTNRLMPCFQGESVWTNGAESSSIVSPETSIGPRMALPEILFISRDACSIAKLFRASLSSARKLGEFFRKIGELAVALKL